MQECACHFFIAFPSISPLLLSFSLLNPVKHFRPIKCCCTPVYSRLNRRNRCGLSVISLVKHILQLMLIRTQALSAQREYLIKSLLPRHTKMHHNTIYMLLSFISPPKVSLYTRKHKDLCRLKKVHTKSMTQLSVLALKNLQLIKSQYSFLPKTPGMLQQLVELEVVAKKFF